MVGHPDFIKQNFRKMMQRRGIDPEQFDEKYIDSSLTDRENMNNLREIYGIQEDDEEAAKEYKAYLEQHPEAVERVDADIPTVGWGRMSMFKSKATQGGGGFKSKAAGGSFIESKKGRLKTPKKPNITRYIPKPINVARERQANILLGAPEGHLRPVQTFGRPPMSIFGTGKKEEPKKKKWWGWL